MYCLVVTMKSSSTTKRIFVTGETITKGSRRILKDCWTKETQSVLGELPESYKAAFRSVGYCNGKHVQILSPYDVPPGKMRLMWMESFEKVRVVNIQPAAKLNMLFAAQRQSPQAPISSLLV